MHHTKPFRIVATVETRDGSEIRHNEIRRSFFDRDLVADLDRFWRITRELAEINHAIARLRIYRDGRAQPVSMRDPPFDPSELPEADRAVTMLEALRKVTH
jgi:hypothetical protein